jgi:hypothetical protein
MNIMLVAAVVAGILLFSAGAIWAEVAGSPVCPNFTPTPTSSGDVPFQGCSALVTVNSDGSMTLVFTPQGDTEDTLMGVTNNSSKTVWSIFVSGSEPFAFDHDFGLSKGPTGYEGPGVTFTIIDPGHGYVNFTGGLAPGKSAYFGLEGAPNAENISIVPPNAIVDRFSGAGGFPPGSGFAGTLRLSNPGSVDGTSPAGDICALIYVFDSSQQMVECCSCKLTPDGLKTLDVTQDLTSNPNNGLFSLSGTGVIKVVSAAPLEDTGICDPTAITFEGVLKGWGTHLDRNGSITETESQAVSMSVPETTKLQRICSIIRTNSSGHGQCTCGSGS